MKLKRLILNNAGLKTLALALALLTWALITGRERSYIERSFDVNVEFINVSENIDIRNMSSERVRITLRGAAKEIGQITSEDIKLKLNLKGINESTKQNFYSENYLEFPEGLSVISSHPRWIEITVEEYISKEVPIIVRYRGKLPDGVRLLERKLIPDKVTIFGYQSQIKGIKSVSVINDVDLNEINESVSIKIPLRKREEILRFEGVDEVEVVVTIADPDEKENDK